MENGKDGDPGHPVLRAVEEGLSHALGNVTILVVYMVVMTVKGMKRIQEFAVPTLALVIILCYKKIVSFNNNLSIFFHCSSWKMGKLGTLGNLF